jgi:hypothetical protein
VLGPSPYFSEVQRPRLGQAVEKGVAAVRALVTQAVPASEPILRRLGFHEVTRLRRLEDPSSTSEY